MFNHGRFYRAQGSAFPSTGGSIELFNELKTGAGNLYNGLRSGTLGLTEYKKGIEDLITQEKFQKLSQTGQITILKEYQQAQQDVIEQQKDYKLEYDTTREAVDGPRCHPGCHLACHLRHGGAHHQNRRQQHYIQMARGKPGGRTWGPNAL